MDKSGHSNKMFHGIGKFPYSSRTRQSSASSISAMSGRRSGIGCNMKKGLTSGRASISGRSNQSMQVIARSEYNIVESYGLPLPVLVSEAITYTEKQPAVSINCSNNGWAWTASGRCLLIWQYKRPKVESPKLGEFERTPKRRGPVLQCRELTLPHCDIGHKASLISVFVTDERQMASCLAVSPTGHVRYWQSIALDGSSIDSTGILEGQELDYMINIAPLGYLLVTTTCSIVLVQVELRNGRHTIQHRIIRPPCGFFGGIGKKFASIIIGISSAPDKENKFVKAVGEQITNTKDWAITILADRWIQHWIFAQNTKEQFVFEDHELFRKVREEFHQKFWSGRENNEIEVTFLDMQVSNSKIYVLCGAINNSHSSQMYYALVQLNCEIDAFNISVFTPLKVTIPINAESENEHLKMRFIVNQGLAYLYTEKIIYPINLINPPEIENEKIEFQAQNDKIMQAAVYDNIPLFFTKIHGLVCVTASDFEPAEFLNSSYMSDIFTSPLVSRTLNQAAQISLNTSTVGALTMYDLDPDEILNTHNDDVGKLKAAFLYHLKRNTAMCTSILNDLLPPAKNEIEETDARLDKIVISIAYDLAEDIPAADPRWEHEDYWNHYKRSGCLGSSSSLQILTQLREKNQALHHFIEFLQNTHLWDRLGRVISNGLSQSTYYALADANEKIIAAIALKSGQQMHSKFVEEAIQMVVLEWNEVLKGNLVHQDVFYVKLTKFQDIFQAFCKIANKLIYDQPHYTGVASALSQINAHVLLMLNEIQEFRENKNTIIYTLPTEKQKLYEYLPWTAASGKHGIRDSITNLIEISLKYGARATGEPELKQRLYQQIVELIDFILDGRKRYVDSITDSEKMIVSMQQYESLRGDLIFPLVEDEQYELATKLAEKYLDFQTLVVICDKTENQQRLDEYIVRYQEFEFSQFAINWHLRQNKQGDLFERFKSNQAALSQFLGDHPSLAWIQLVFNGDFGRASEILFQLAQDETEYLARKKTILSLAKISSLAIDADTCSLVTEINLELALIDYQEQIPENILESLGYDVNSQRVLKADEIIYVLVSDEYNSANEFDFRRALELLNYVEDPFELRHKIWCAAILRSTWTDLNLNCPLDEMQNMLFFKLIDLCYLMDGDLEESLPPIDDFLQSSDLGDLIHNKSFQFLLKLGYEHIYDSYQKNIELNN